MGAMALRRLMAADSEKESRSITNLYDGLQGPPLLGQLCIRKRLVDREQIMECRRAQIAFFELGQRRRLGQLLVRREFRGTTEKDGGPSDYELRITD